MCSIPHIMLGGYICISIPPLRKLAFTISRALEYLTTVMIDVERYRIMIVEDNLAVARAIGFALERAGYETLWCDDETIYSEIRRWHPHLILMDLRMPLLDGERVTNVLKADPETESIPVIIVTADLVTPERMRLSRANDLVHKPFLLTQLLERITFWLAGGYSQSIPPRIN